MSAVEAIGLTRAYIRPVQQAGFLNSLRGLLFRQHEAVAAIDDISFRLEAGQAVGLIGPNGSGKSTLIKLLTGILTPTSGRLTVLGERPAIGNDDLKRRYAVVLGKKNQLWWDLPARETFRLHQAIYGLPRPLFTNRLEELVAALDIGGLIDRPVRSLSLGERMKCELVTALLHKPELLMLDEPTIGLDHRSQTNLRAFLKAYLRRSGATLLLTSHHLSDIQELTDQLLVLDRGRIAYFGARAALVGDLAAFSRVDVELDSMGPGLDLRRASAVLGVELGTPTQDGGLSILLRTDQVNDFFHHAKDQLPIRSVSVGAPHVNDLFKHIGTDPGARP
jgi:ABC-2 type transport system ATP-binding protein